MTANTTAVLIFPANISDITEGGHSVFTTDDIELIAPFEKEEGVTRLRLKLEHYDYRTKLVF